MSLKIPAILFSTLAPLIGDDLLGSSISFVEIADPGNSHDNTGFGRVDYVYRMGTYEVNRPQIFSLRAGHKVDGGHPDGDPNGPPHVRPVADGPRLRYLGWMKSRFEEVRADPQANYETPRMVLADERLSGEEQLEVLQQWKAQAIHMQESTGEGFDGGEHSHLDEVAQALHELEK